MPLTNRQLQMMKRHIAALRDDARVFDATVELFQPEFEACWERRSGGGMGAMHDGERALQLRTLVLDGKKNAKYNRELADLIEKLLSTSGALNMEH